MQMPSDSYEQVVTQMKSQLNQLLLSRSYTAREIASNLGLGDVPGVYILLTPDGSKIVYAGKTVMKTVAGRIKDHLNIGTSSDLKGMLGRFKDYPQDANSYLVRYLKIEDDRERGLIEHFLIAILNPPFNSPKH